MSRKKKNENKEPQISIGKDYEKEQELLSGMKDAPILTSLDEIWGVKKKRQFPADNEDEYRGYLKGLNKVDLQRECIKNGLPARDSRDSMSNALVKEFRRHIAVARASQAPLKVIPNSPELTKLMERASNNL